MKKSNIIDLHTALYNVRELMIERGYAEETDFEQYNEIGVTPEDDNLPINQHQYAIFTLGSELSAVFSDSPMSEEKLISDRLSDIAGSKGDELDIPR